MSDQKDVFAENKTVTSKIEDEILKHLDGDVQETALGFVAYLNEHNMAPKQWFGPTIWRIPYEEKYLCGIFLNRTGKFRIYFFKCDYCYRGEFDERFIKTVHDHVIPCVNCGGDCPKGITTTVFGKEFANSCFQFPIQFENPDDNTLKLIKELIEYWTEVVPPSDSWHAR